MYILDDQTSQHLVKYMLIRDNKIGLHIIGFNKIVFSFAF